MECIIVCFRYLRVKIEGYMYVSKRRITSELKLKYLLSEANTSLGSKLKYSVPFKQEYKELSSVNSNTYRYTEEVLSLVVRESKESAKH